MLPLFFVHSADTPGVGRINESLLPEQTRMELLVMGASDEYLCTVKDESDAFKDVEEWKGVETRKDGSIRSIDFEMCVTIETLSMEWLPERLHVLKAVGNDLVGTFDFTALPVDLRSLGINGNKYSGTADLSALPPPIVHIAFGSNKFSGSLNLNSLPPRLRTLIASDNQLSGVLDVRAIAMPIRHPRFPAVLGNHWCEDDDELPDHIGVTFFGNNFEPVILAADLANISALNSFKGKHHREIKDEKGNSVVVRGSSEQKRK